MNKRIKVFLGGYVNCTNAQNLNCKSLAKYLDKNKFECAVMTLYSGNLPLENDLNGIKIFKCHRPFRIWKYITYLRGIFWCDVAYLPKGEIWKYCSICLRFFRKKSFTTVEGVISGTNLDKSIRYFGTQEKILKAYNYTSQTYSITAFMAEKNRSLLNIKSDGVLYLGIDTTQFKPLMSYKKELKNVIFIGNNIRYKGIDDYFTLAQKFPNVTFHIVGDGLGYNVRKEIKNRNLNNCIYYGLLDHAQLSEVLKKMDLHIFPSRSEGFPKVTLETASMGVPSIVYGDYGADEWITSGKDGFVVNTVNEITLIISDLMIHPQKLDLLAKSAIELSKKFDWNNVINDWQSVIEDLYNSKSF